MKFFKLMMIALVAMIGLSSCSESSSSDSTCDHDLTCDHNFIEVDYSKDIVGTWTVLLGNYAEAMVINADGTMNRTMVMEGKLVEYSLRYELVSNQITLFYENGDVEKGRVDVIPDVGLSITLDDKTGDAYKFFCCENDLSDEIVGMWVCNSGIENDMVINTFAENGKSYITTFLADENDYVVNKEGGYKVVGNLLIKTVKGDSDTSDSYIVIGLDYMPNGTELGDIMTMYLPTYGANPTFLRISQSLDLAGKTYDYISAYVSNAKGKDEDFSIWGNTLNISKIDAYDIDMMFRSVLSYFEFDTDSMKYKFCLDEGNEKEVDSSITVEGNKVTVDMSVGNPAYRKVEMYMFQDADDCQLHIYMPTKSFINYFANLQIPSLVAEGKLDLTDDVAIEKVFDDMEARIESINVSFVLKARE